MAINKLSKYHIVVDDLKSKIMSGTLVSGDLVPSENQLSKEYNISRVTVRKALAVLVNEGYIFTVQGKGNFVSDPKVCDYIFQFRSEEHSWDTKLISAEIVKPSTDIRIHMQFYSDNKAVEIKRYMIYDGDIIGYGLKYVPYNPKEPILEKEFHYINLDEKSENGIRKSVKLKAIGADEEIAKLLSIKSGHPMFLFETKTENANKEIIGYEKTYVMGDRYQIIGI